MGIGDGPGGASPSPPNRGRGRGRVPDSGQIGYGDGGASPPPGKRTPDGDRGVRALGQLRPSWHLRSRDLMPVARAGPCQANWAAAAS
jgi:hypothetical protein